MMLWNATNLHNLLACPNIIWRGCKNRRIKCQFSSSSYGTDIFGVIYIYTQCITGFHIVWNKGRGVKRFFQGQVIRLILPGLYWWLPDPLLQRNTITSRLFQTCNKQGPRWSLAFRHTRSSALESNMKTKRDLWTIVVDKLTVWFENMLPYYSNMSMFFLVFFSWRS